MSVAASNVQYQTVKWPGESSDLSGASLVMTTGEPEVISSNVDDGLTSLSWLQNLNMCMTRLGAPTPPTPPASPVCFGFSSITEKVSNTVVPPIVTVSKSSTLSSSSGKVGSKVSNCKAKPQSISSTAVATKGDTSKKKLNCQVKSSSSKQNAKKCSSSYPTTTTNVFQEMVDYKLNGSIKPPYSYATLICMAMKANENKMTLSSIYKWIKENFLYYQNADPSWQNSIRHNLSLNKCFIKIPRNKDEPGKGGFWKLDPVYADTLVDGVFKKRRPNQRLQHDEDTENSSEKGPSKKKSRKRHQLWNDSSKDYIEAASKVQQETPPSSAESYNNKEKMVDMTELSNAVNSIENNNLTYTYALHATGLVECEAANLASGYSNEVCIGNTSSGTDCIVETDNADICWNAILTDADLNELVDPINYSDSSTQIIHSVDGDSLQNASFVSNKEGHHTAQLTAVEPHELDILASAGDNNLLEDQQIFYQGSQIHGLTFDTHVSNIITATSNVVTCINDGNLSCQWGDWGSYTPSGSSLQVECANQNGELILSQMEQGPDQLGIGDISMANGGEGSITYVDSISSTSTKHSSVNEPTSISRPLDSQSSNSYESNSSIQSWIGGKSSLDPNASLELDSFTNLDHMHQF